MLKNLLRKQILFTNPSAPAGYDTRSIFKRSLTGVSSEFSFSWTSCLTKAEEPSLSYYIPIAGGRIIGFIHFPRVLVLCEMQWVSSRIWTRVAEFISYDDNNYTTGTSLADAVKNITQGNNSTIMLIDKLFLFNLKWFTDDLLMLKLEEFLKERMFVFHAKEILTWPFGWAVWYSCRMKKKSITDSWPKGHQLRLGHLRVGELQPLSPMYSTKHCSLV